MAQPTAEPTTGVIVALAQQLEITLATAESLTSGRVCATLAEVPGASEVLLGGVVSYAVEAKQDVLGVSRDTLEAHGPVSEEVAQEMASGVRRVLKTRLGIATTGAAGPAPHGGEPPGTVWLAVDLDGDLTTRLLHIDGNREEVTDGAVEGALVIAHEVLLAHQQHK